MDESQQIIVAIYLFFALLLLFEGESENDLGKVILGFIALFIASILIKLYA